MKARLAFVSIVAALALAPVAFADGPGMTPVQDPQAFVTAPQLADGPAAPRLRYDAVASGWRDTVLQETRASDGGYVRWRTLRGSWGMPQISWGLMGGLSADGRRLVLQSMRRTYGTLARHTSFLVVDTKRLRPVQTIRLRGDFNFDALSPSGSMLYLVRHVSADQTRYVVRAYDLRRGTLLSRRIADRTQTDWVMQGQPLTRTTSADGRWVYTLYSNPGGYPFVHALDTIAAQAHCIGIPWPSGRDQSPLYANMRLHLREADRTLALDWRSGRPFLRIEAGSWRIEHPAVAGFPWWTLGIAAGVATLLAAARSRRRARSSRAA